MAALISKPGITRVAISTGVPKAWSQNWFRDFVSDYLKGGDVRNAVGANGITISGNITSPYATISIGGPGFPIKGQITINAAGADGTSTGTGRAALFVGGPNAYTVEISGSATVGQSYGLLIAAGTTAADTVLSIINQARTSTFLTVLGTGAITIGQTTTGVANLTINASSAVSPSTGLAIQGDGTHDTRMSVASVTLGDAYIQTTTLGITDWSFGNSRGGGGAFIFSATTGLGTGRLALDTGGILYPFQPTPTAVNATATLTIAQMRTLIITSTSAAAVTMTLPTGTLADAGILAGIGFVNICFDWSIINTGPSLVTLAAGTAHTIVGTTTTATLTSSQWRTRKTAANTFVTYRLS